MSEPSRKGRPRDYNLAPSTACANAEAAYLLALLDEATARLFDLIVDLRPEHLAAAPAGCANSIQMLTTHMTWGEVTWLGHATGVGLSDELAAVQPAGRFPKLDLTAEQLIEQSVRVREQYTKPLLRELCDIDRVAEAGADRAFPRGVEAVTVRGALMHQIWHWTYHGGQVGLLRRMVGPAYSWSLEPRMVGRAEG